MDEGFDYYSKRCDIYRYYRVSHIPKIFKGRTIQAGTHKKFTEKFSDRVSYIISIKIPDKRTKKR